MSPEKKRAMIKRDHPELSISQQCKLVRLSRSVFYYTPVGIDADRIAESIRAIAQKRKAALEAFERSRAKRLH